jgi:glyoxylase-like metal-dependent hydrolase (beta-lactamase superfamily II)
MNLVPLTKQLYRLDGENKGRFPRAHAFYVKDEICALIDSGCGIKVLEAFKKKRNRVDLVINSHCHPDHGAGNWLFPDHPIWVPDDGTNSHGRINPLAHRLVEPGALAETWKAFVREAMGFQNSRPTHHYRDGYVFDFGRLKLTAISTPGHTLDHFCLFDSYHGLLLSFDIDLTAYGPWYGNRESDLAGFRSSLQKIRALKLRNIASSHREVIGIDSLPEELDRYEAVFERRNNKILGLLTEKPRRMDELLAASPFYGGHTYAADLLGYWEGQMIRKHLEELIGQGLVWEEGDRFGLV